MGAEYENTAEFRGASFEASDLSGARFRDCDLSRVKIVDSWLDEMNVSGMARRLIVNDIDVTGFVEGELDRRHPERARVREMRTADEYRTVWELIERLWTGTTARAERLPEPVRHERVDGEWSFVETMRHLIFATDAWAGAAILDEAKPYHRLGYVHSSYPRSEAIALGIDLDARPSYAEVMEVRAERLTLVRRIVDGLVDAELERVCPRLPAPGYPDEERTVGYCLRVVMQEECEHRRYMQRDLAVLEEARNQR